MSGRLQTYLAPSSKPLDVDFLLVPGNLHISMPLSWNKSALIHKGLVPMLACLGKGDWSRIIPHERNGSHKAQDPHTLLIFATNLRAAVSFDMILLSLAFGLYHQLGEVKPKCMAGN